MDSQEYFTSEVFNPSFGWGSAESAWYTGGGGGLDWGGILNTVVNVGANYAVGSGAGMPGGALVPCAQDDQFSRKWYPTFAAKARQSGYPASSWWFGNIIVVMPTGQCGRGPAIATLELARQWWNDYASRIGPIWNQEADGSFHLNSRAGTSGVPSNTNPAPVAGGGSSGVIFPTGGGTGGFVTQGVSDFLPWIIGAGALALIAFSGPGRRR